MSSSLQKKIYKTIKKQLHNRQGAYGTIMEYNLHSGGYTGIYQCKDIAGMSESGYKVAVIHFGICHDKGPKSVIIDCYKSTKDVKSFKLDCTDDKGNKPVEVEFKGNARGTLKLTEGNATINLELDFNKLKDEELEIDVDCHQEFKVLAQMVKGQQKNVIKKLKAVHEEEQKQESPDDLPAVPPSMDDELPEPPQNDLFMGASPLPPKPAAKKTFCLGNKVLPGMGTCNKDLEDKLKARKEFSELGHLTGTGKAKRRLCSAETSPATDLSVIFAILLPLLILLVFMFRRFYAPVETSFDKKHDKDSDDFSMV